MVIHHVCGVERQLLFVYGVYFLNDFFRTDRLYRTRRSTAGASTDLRRYPGWVRELVGKVPIEKTVFRLLLTDYDHAS